MVNTASILNNPNQIFPKINDEYCFCYKNPSQIFPKINYEYCFCYKNPNKIFCKINGEYCFGKNVQLTFSSVSLLVGIMLFLLHKNYYRKLDD